MRLLIIAHLLTTLTGPTAPSGPVPVQSPEVARSYIVIRHTVNMISRHDQDAIRHILQEMAPDVRFKAVAWDDEKMEIADASADVDRNEALRRARRILEHDACDD
jgi:hypothetical protein